MKALKKDLKVWNEEVFGDKQKQLEEVVLQMNNIEIQGDMGDISDGLKDLKKELQRRFWELANYNESILKQKSRLL